jgi:hypothetical protein
MSRVDNFLNFVIAWLRPGCGERHRRARPSLDGVAVFIAGLAGRRTEGTTGLADAARSITSQAAVTVGRPFANKMAPRHALHVPSPSNWILKRGEGRDSVQSVSKPSIMRVVSIVMINTHRRQGQAHGRRGPVSANLSACADHLSRSV